MLDLQTEENGYAEVSPPVLVREEVLFGVGNLPKFEDDLFKTDRRPLPDSHRRGTAHQHRARDHRRATPICRGAIRR